MTDPMLGYASRQSAYFLPVAGRAKAARITMTILLVSNLLGLMLLPGALKVDQLVAEENPANQGTLLALGLALLGGACIQIIAWIVAVVFFLMWIHRACRGAWALVPTGFMTIRPGWAVGWWFIPFANLVMPYRAMKEIWTVSAAANRSSDLHGMPVTGKLGAWWALFLIGGFTTRVGDKLMDKNLVGSMMPGLVVSTIGTLLHLGAGILCIKLISEITRQLESQAASLQAAGASHNSGEL